MYLLLEAMDKSCLSKVPSGEVVKAFDKAIEAASRDGLIHHEALSNELVCAYLHGKGGNKKNDSERSEQFETYLSRAHVLYREWGATAKVDHLRQQYGNGE